MLFYLLILFIIIIIIYSYINISGSGPKINFNTDYIFHIVDGLSAEKHIVNKLDNRFIIINTDEINDKNYLEILKQGFNFSKLKDEGKAEKIIAEKNKQDLLKILNTRGYKPVVIIGYLHIGMFFVGPYVIGYTIKIEPVELWKQYHDTVLDIMHNRYDELKKFINSIKTEKDMGNVRTYLEKKFNIRNGFDCEDIYDIKEHERHRKLNSKNSDYKYLEANDIIKDIYKILKL